MLNCWNLWLAAFLRYLCLFLLEHAALCLPLIALRAKVDNRAFAMQEAFFPTLPEEDFSSANIDFLLGAGFGVALLLPLLQIGLAFAYFRCGHPWSRVFRAHVTLRELNR